MAKLPPREKVSINAIAAGDVIRDTPTRGFETVESVRAELRQSPGRRAVRYYVLALRSSDDQTTRSADFASANRIERVVK